MGGGQGTGRTGNMTEDQEKAPGSGQKGGQASGGRQSRDADQSTGGGQGSGRGGNFADDMEKTSGAERKGGDQGPGGGRKS